MINKKTNIKQKDMEYIPNVYDKKESGEASFDPYGREKYTQEQGFVRYWNLPDINHNINQTPFQLIKKLPFGEEDHYENDSNIFSKKPPFKLYFKRIGVQDYDKVLGLDMDTLDCHDVTEMNKKSDCGREI